MKCQRCLRDEEATHRVYTDVMDVKVCAACANEARELRIAVEILDDGHRGNDRAESKTELHGYSVELSGDFRQ